MVHVYSTSDWVCIYIDGKKVTEGHSYEYTFEEGVQFGMRYGKTGFQFFTQIDDDDFSFPNDESEMSRNGWIETH